MVFTNEMAPGTPSCKLWPYCPSPAQVTLGRSILMTPSHFSLALEPESQRFSANSIPYGLLQVGTPSELIFKILVTKQCCSHLLLLATDFLLSGEKNALSLRFPTGINTFLSWSN